MTRILIGLLLAAGTWAMVFLAPQPVLVGGVAVLTVLALREFFGIAPAGGARPISTLGYAGALVWLLVPTVDRGFLASLLAIVFLGTGVLARLPLATILPSAGVALAGVVYIAAPMLWGLQLHAMSPHWLVYAVLVTAVGDTAALAVGKLIGRRKLAPAVSPAKTWEGTIASAVAGTAAGGIYATAMLGGELGTIEAFALALVVSTVGQIGDLAESAIKRAAGKKNSGNLLPGHGGILDRIDGLLFALPAVYGYLRFFR